MSNINNIHPILTSFKKIVPREALGIWEELITGDPLCYVVEYPQGYRITENNETLFFKHVPLQRPLGIVLSGNAEICETYEVQKCVAYRPIRILNPGDLLGDFSIIDYMLGLGGHSRPNELWGVYAGAKSILLTPAKPIKNKRILLRLEDENNSTVSLHCPHMIFDYILNKKTIIGFIKSDFIEINSPFFNTLIASAWNRARVYRTCINSFNFSTLLKFRQKTKKASEELIKEKARKGIIYSTDISIKDLFPLFCDAIYDAYNRPLRGEPMFSVCSKLLENEDVGKTLGEFNLLPKDILIASHEQNEFYFPIDYSNYLLAAHYGENNTLDSTMNRIFAGKQQSNGNATLAGAGTTPRDFYRDIANKLLTLLSSDFPNYPFDVSCEDIMGSQRRHLILHFKKKP